MNKKRRGRTGSAPRKPTAEAPRGSATEAPRERAAESPPEPAAQPTPEAPPGHATSPTPPRRGRRPGAPDTRDAVLAAARARFGGQGYEATTMRQVAGDAGVDPALVHYFFGTKAALFVAAVEYPVNPADVIATVVAAPRERIGETLLRTFVAIWDERGATPLFALLRSAADHEHAAALLREFITREVVGRIAREIDADAADLRATLCGSQVVGLAMVRYVLRVEPLASADVDTLAAWIGPTLQRYLTGDAGTVSP